MRKDGIKVKVINFLLEAGFVLYGIFTISNFFTAHALNVNRMIFNLGILGTGIILLLLVLNTEITGRHYDKYLKETMINSEYIDDFFINITLPFSNKTLIKLKIFRAPLYMQAIVAPSRYKNRNKTLRKLFGNFDFEPHINIVETILAWLCFLSGLFVLMSGLVYIILLVFN